MDNEINYNSKLRYIAIEDSIYLAIDVRMNILLMREERLEKLLSLNAPPQIVKNEVGLIYKSLAQVTAELTHIEGIVDGILKDIQK